MALKICIYLGASVRSGTDVEWWDQSHIHSSDSSLKRSEGLMSGLVREHFFMDLFLCSGICHAKTKRSHCLKILMAWLDFMHFFAMDVADKPVYFKVVSTYIWPRSVS